MKSKSKKTVSLNNKSFLQSVKMRVLLFALVVIALGVLAGGNRQISTSTSAEGRTDTLAKPAGKKASMVCTASINLIANGDAESDPTAVGDGSTNQDVTNWENEIGGFTVTRYGASGGYPASGSPGPAERGIFFFSGGSTGTSGAIQTIDVSGCSTSIDNGNQQFNLSGFLGGYQGQNDQAQVIASFKNDAGTITGTSAIGPVTAADRGSVTGLFPRNSSGTLPVGTRTIEISIQMTRFNANSNDAYADNLSFVLMPPQTCSTVPSGIVSWWKAEGNADDVLGINNGTLQNGAGFSTGVVGQAFNFDGIDDHVVINGSSSLDVGASSGFTLEAWINPTDISVQKPIIEWHNGTGFGVHFWISVFRGGDLYANIVGTNGVWNRVMTTSPVITANEFQHVAVTYDKTTGMSKLFRNGVMVAEANLSIINPATASNYNVYLGQRVGERFKGAIDEPSIYNRVLSPAEIVAVYASGSGGKCSSFCNYTLSSSSALIPANGSSGNFTVTTTGSCPWTAISSSDWITTGSSGSGSGTINFTVEANPGATRTGTITVGNRTFTITQAASGTVIYNGHTYRLTTNAKSWSEAEAEAASEGGHLVTISDAAEQTFLVNNFVTGANDTRPLWIGINDAAVEGTFVWVSGEPLTYTNWNSGEPSNSGGNEDFGTLNWHRASTNGTVAKGTWNDSPVSGTSGLGGNSNGPYFGIIEIGGIAPCAPAPANLVGWWKAEGNANDMLGVNNAVLQNGTAFSTGFAGQAFSFDGINDYATISRPVQDDFTFEFWLNSTQIFNNSRQQWYDGTGLIDGEVGGVTDDFGISLLSGRVHFGTGKPDTTIRSDVVTDGFWHHVAASRKRSTGELKLYIDGVEAAAGVGGTQSLSAPPRIVFGRLQTNINHFQGKLDEISVYDRVLSAAEIQTIYNARTTGKCGLGAIQSFTLNPNPVNGGQSSTGTIVLRNPAPAGGALVNLVGINPSIVTLPSSVTIPAGTATGTFTITTTVPVNDTTALITASYQNETGSASLTVIAPRADLVVSSANAPDGAVTDTAFNIFWKLRNQGAAAVNTPFVDRILLSTDNQPGSDTLLAEFPFSNNLEPNQTADRIQTITIPRNAVPTNGQYFLIFQTDGGGQVLEENEGNNFIVRPINVTRPPKADLIVENITAPAAAFFDRTILVQFTVKNIGGGATNASDWQDFLYLSVDNIPEIEDPFKVAVANTSYLAAGESYTTTKEIRIPKGLVGQYKIVVWTDGDGTNHRSNIYPHRVSEENDENNYGVAIPIQINAPPLPDLRVSNVIAPEQSFAGGQISLNWRVENNGNGITPQDQINWQDKIYLSQDTTFNAATDRLIGLRGRSGALGQNEGYTVSNYSVALPNDIVGDWYVFVMADGDNQVYEFSNENNNSDYDRQQPGSPVHINATPPDLIIPDSIDAPNVGQTGQTITVNFKVRNQGAFDAAPSWFDGVYISADQTLNTETDTLLTSVFRNAPLAPGATYNVSADVTLSSCITGTYYLFVGTDSRRQIFEFDPKQNAENNNSSAPHAITITEATSDLVVNTVDHTTAADAGQPLNVSWTVSNIGTGSTVRPSWQDRVYLSPTPVFNVATAILVGSFDHNGALNSGNSYTRSENITIPNTAQGSYFVAVVTDVSGEIEECANNGNNSRTGIQPITVSNNLPDLTAQNVTLQGTFLGGQTIDILWSVMNNGAIAVNNPNWGDAVYFSTDATLSSNDVRLATSPAGGPLAAGNSYNRQLQAVLPIVTSGNYFVIVQTDYLNNVFEGQGENNNHATAALMIGVPAVDLTVTSVNAPESALSGQNMTVSWNVSNLGGNPTAGSVLTDEIVLSLDQIDDPSDRVVGVKQHNGVVNGGAGYNESLSVLVPQGFSGQYYVFVRTDRHNNIAESNEANNSAVDGVIINLTPPADLVVSSINASAEGRPGESITFGWTTQNIGANPALGIWNDAVYLSTDQTWDINDVLVGKQSQAGPVPGGQSYNAVLTLALPAVNPGDYYVIVRTDIRNFVRENNDGNNTTTAVTQTSITVRDLPIGVPINTTMINGQRNFYGTNVPASESLRFILDGQTGSENELFAHFGQIASPLSFDYKFSRPYEPDQEIVIPNTQSGKYFSMVENRFSPSQPQNVTIKAEIIPFGITSVSPNRVGDNGQVTITLKGARFEEGASVKLVRGSTILNAAVNLRVDSSTVKARFLFTNAPRGVYDVVLTNPGGQSTTLSSSVTIEPTQTAQPTIISTGNLRTRPLRPVVYYNEVSNRGNVDIQYVSISTEVFRPNSSTPVTIINYRPETSLPRKSHFPDVDWNNNPLTNANLRGMTSDTFLYRDLAPGESFSYNTEIRGLTAGNSYIRNQVFGLTRDEFISTIIESSEFLRQQLLFNGINFPNVGSAEDFLNSMLFGYKTYEYLDGIVKDAPSSFRDLIKSGFKNLGKVNLIDLGVDLGESACNLLVDYANPTNCNLKCGLRFACTNIGTVAYSVEALLAARTLNVPAAIAGGAAAGQSLAKAIQKGRTCFDNCPQPPPTDCELSANSNSEDFTPACVNNPMDPNEKLSPDGFGEQRYVSLRQEIPYTINFENLSTATAYAQRIRITDQLNPNLDWRTFRLREIGFKQYRFQVPENRAFFQQRVQLGEDLGNLFADITAGIDITTGTVTWTLTAIDPATGEQPNGVNLGLLPPNNDNNDGQGFITFTVKPKATAANGSLIRNQATITFDTEESIITNQVSNTLDADFPESQIAGLPPVSEPTFTVNWSGSDPANGSGLRSYDVLVSENGAPYQPFVNGTTNTSAQFIGSRGKTYRFYSIAKDNAGNVEDVPADADTATTVSGGAFEADVAPRPNGNNNGNVTVADLTQVGRFVAGLDTPDQPTATNEFQRTDTAPRISSGNGFLTVADITQAGRYVAGLDPLQTAGGAISPSLISSLKNDKPNNADVSDAVTNLREIYPTSLAREDNKILIAVEMNTGSGKAEANSVGFTLNYNPAVLSNPTNIRLGSGANGASLISNTNQSAQGRIGIVIFKSVDQTFPAGRQRLVTIEFNVAANAPSATPVSFGDQPVVREVSDVEANSLPANFMTTNVSLAPPTAALLSIGGRVSNSAGVGISNAKLTLVYANGVSKTVQTNSFGYYSFTDIPAASTVAIRVSAKRYSFTSNTQVVSVQEDNFGINFTADD